MTESPNVLVTIDVTEDDIEKGEAHRSCSCALALAVKRAVKTDVSIETRMLRLRNFSGRIVYEVLHNQGSFVTAFDLHKYRYSPGHPRPKPISFQIEVPKEYVKCS